MNTKGKIFALIIIGATVPTLLMGKGRDADGQHLEGSWLVTAQANVSEPPLLLRALLTCTRDGEVVETPETPFAVSNAHGAWARSGNNVFSMTVVYLRRGEDGTFIGTSKVRSSLTLNSTADAISGRFQTDVFDVDGTLVDSFGGTAQATRIQVQPLD